MSKVKEKVSAFRAFFDDVLVEAKKATWPTRQELMQSTVMVIVSVVLLSLFVGVSDKILVTILKWLIPSG